MSSPPVRVFMFPPNKAKVSPQTEGQPEDMQLSVAAGGQLSPQVSRLFDACSSWRVACDQAAGPVPAGAASRDR